MANSTDKRDQDPSPSSQATMLLARVSEGDAEAANDLLPLVYDQLRAMAGGQFKGERADHTLQPTALVHEAYMKLIKVEGTWKNRAHFCAIAASAMRKILINHARAKRAGKRDANQVDITIDAFATPSGATALGLVDPTSADIVGALIELLHDEDLNVQSMAARAVGKIGEEAKAAVPSLIMAIKNADGEFCEDAIEALGSFGLDSKDALPLLVEAVADKSEEVSCHAIRTLSSIGQDAKYAVPALAKALDDPVARHDAADLLGRLGPDAKDAVPALILVLKDDDCDVRTQAVWALGRIGPVTDRVVPALIEALYDPDYDVHEAAELALSNVGVKAPMETVPLLLEVTPRDDDSLARYGAFAALGRIGLPAVPGLIEKLNGPCRLDRRFAATQLGYMRSPGDEAVSALTTALEDQDAEVRESAAYALREINETESVTH